jgi:hypothetical protein
MIFGNNPAAWYAKYYYARFRNSKKSYYENFYKVVDVGQLLSKMVPVIQHFARTAYPIRILNVPFDISPALLIKLLGEPKSERTETGIPAFERKTFFYKRAFFESKAIFQFNFFNEVFTSCVVSFVRQKDSNERLFLQIIREKYLLPADDETLQGFDGIVDAAGNLILYEESVYPCLVYVNAQIVHNNLQDQVDEKLKMMQLVHWNKHYRDWSQLL